MPRLVAFGCSFTQGWDLHDQYILERQGYYNSQPSNFAYPKICAKLLNYECVNLAKGGNSNIEILSSILKFNFESDDICVVGWSFFDRINFVKYNEDIHNFDRLPYHIKNSEGLDSSVNTDSNTSLKNYYAIHHAECYLKNKNIKYYGLKWVHDFYTFIKPSFLHVKLLDFNPRTLISDKAGDNRHPGIKSHKLIGEKLCEIIKSDLNV